MESGAPGRLNTRQGFVVKNTVSEQIGLDTCAELDLDTGELTVLQGHEDGHGATVQPNGILLLVQFLSDHALVIAQHIQKVSE